MFRKASSTGNRAKSLKIRVGHVLFCLQVRPLVENQLKWDFISNRPYLGNHLEFQDFVFTKMLLMTFSTENKFESLKK